MPPPPSAAQMRVLRAIAEGRSVFVTGSAGTGKSFLLAHVLATLRSAAMYGPDAVFVTASTGLAACNIGGTTLHSFAGIGLGRESAADLTSRILGRREARLRWLRAKALILDEVSMVDGDLFDKIEKIARNLKQSEKPFGGIQLVVTGDFYQLPPVKEGGQPQRFAFEAESWGRCMGMQLELRHVFRQADRDFVGLLNELRQGRCSAGTLQRLQSCSSGAQLASAQGGDGIEPTRLYPHKVDVARENLGRLQQLRGEELTFVAMDIGGGEHQRKLLDATQAAREVRLRVGAQVMLVKNLDQGAGLVNGARGVVEAFVTPVSLASLGENAPHARQISASGRWPSVRFACLGGSPQVVGPESWSINEGPKVLAKRVQVPLALGWALSVHKCQGMTLDRVETDLSKAFDDGMVYVALSRVRSLEGLVLSGFDPRRIKVNPKVASFYEQIAFENADESPP
eukprot:SM000036S13349  [mRNA]  locus=s36:729059:731408:- [translate_table: standard]